MICGYLQHHKPKNIKMNLKLSLTALLMTISFCAVAQETNAPKFGKGLFNLVGQDSTWTMKVATRMQFLAIANFEEGESAESNFLVRRARLKFDGYAFSPKLEYKLELGLSNRDISGASEFTSDAPRYILDAVIKYNFAPGLRILVWANKTTGQHRACNLFRKSPTSGSFSLKQSI